MEKLLERISEYARREPTLGKKFFYDHLKSVKKDLAMYLSDNITLKMKCIKASCFVELSDILSKGR